MKVFARKQKLLFFLLISLDSIPFCQSISLANLVNAMEDPGRSIKDDTLLTQFSEAAIVMVAALGRGGSSRARDERSEPSLGLLARQFSLRTLDPSKPRTIFKSFTLTWSLET